MRYIAAFWRGGLVVGHTVVSMLTDGLESRSHSFRIPFARALVSPQPEWPRQTSTYAFSITFFQVLGLIAAHTAPHPARHALQSMRDLDALTCGQRDYATLSPMRELSGL